MKNRSYVKKNDYKRIILTELTPYETPLFFSTENWYRMLTNNSTKYIFTDSKNFSIPYKYSIKKNADDFRKLSIMHPKHFLQFISFFQKYDSYILYNCSKQKRTSLRYPSKVTSIFYSDEAKHKMDESIEIDETESELIEYVKFFSYQKFDGIYKYYDSPEYQRMEKKYRYCMQSDIAKCFYNIYTHSICWSVKEKRISKSVKKTEDPFESSFDFLMQKTNYNETYGIIVGPEVSRIFAEIILQKIDTNIINDLYFKYKIVFGKDYEFRRYIDDYFFYYNKQDTIDILYLSAKEKLLEYNLFFNESKSKTMPNPFISSLTISKCAVSDLFDQNFKDINNLVTSFSFRSSTLFITRIKQIIHENNVSYSSISKYVLGSLENVIDKCISYLLNHNLDDNRKNDLFQSIFNIVFFIYDMDIRVDTTYKLSKMLMKIVTFLKQNCSAWVDFIRFVFVECDYCVARFKYEKDTAVNMEVINFILTVQALHNYCISNKVHLSGRGIIDKIFNIKNCLSKDFFINYDYFSIIIFIHCYGKSHPKKMKYLMEHIADKFKNASLNLDTDVFLLFIDLIACPFQIFTDKYKAGLFNTLDKNEQFHKEINKIGIKPFIKTMQENRFSFTNWEDITCSSIELLLTKKPSSGYDR